MQTSQCLREERTIQGSIRGTLTEPNRSARAHLNGGKHNLEAVSPGMVCESWESRELWATDMPERSVNGDVLGATVDSVSLRLGVGVEGDTDALARSVEGQRPVKDVRREE